MNCGLFSGCKCVHTFILRHYTYLALLIVGIDIVFCAIYVVLLCGSYMDRQTFDISEVFQANLSVGYSLLAGLFNWLASQQGIWFIH